MKSKPSKLRRVLEVVSGLLTVLKFLPLGQWKNVVIALSAGIGSVIALVEKCEKDPIPSSPPPAQSTPTQAPPTPTPTLTHTPTPKPPEIMVPERIIAGEPFLVRVSAPFAYNTALTVYETHLCLLGKEYKTGIMSCMVTLWSTGRRILRVKLSNGTVLEKAIEVRPAT